VGDIPLDLEIHSLARGGSLMPTIMDFPTMLRTIGEACRAVKGELLEQLVDWIVDKLADDQWSIPQIKAVLVQT